MFRKWIVCILWAVPFVGTAQNIDLLILDKNYQQALIQINKSLDVRPDADTFLKKSQVYRMLNKPISAANSLENAIAIDSLNILYLAEYADLQTELGNNYKAVQFYQRAVDLSTGDLNLKSKLGKSYMNVENYQKAFEVFMSIQTKDSTNLVYNKQLGLAAMKIGKTDLAINMFESVLERNSNDFNAYVNLILLYLKKKDAVQIVRTADRALYFFPDNPAILLREANALYSIKEYEEARPAFEHHFAQNDPSFDLLENYGISLYFLSDDTTARKILEKCLVLDPTNQFVNYYLGLICKRMADLPKSAEYLNMAIAASQPAYLTEMYHHLGQVFGLQREFKKSIEALQEAYQCNPLRTEILVEIATTYEESDINKKLALSYYQKYLQEAGDKAVNADFAQERIRMINQIRGK
jgi:tetratricopeptide (TPR) repeat protein